MNENETLFELNKFKERLEILRKLKSITQKQLAEEINVSTATISSYEKGYKSPSAVIVKRIAEKYDVSMDWLCGLSDSMGERNITTYANIANRLFEFDESYKISIGLDLYELRSSYGNPDYEPISDSCIYFKRREDDKIINDFLVDWKKMKELKEDGTIDEEVYTLWKEKTAKNLSRIPIKSDNVNSEYNEITNSADNDDTPF